VKSNIVTASCLKMMPRALGSTLMATRRLSLNSKSYAKAAQDKPKVLSREEKQKLQRILPVFRTAEDNSLSSSSESTTLVTTDSEQSEMDVIRARGFLKYRHNYTPDIDVERIVREEATNNGIELQPESWMTTALADLSAKANFLIALSKRLRHSVSNSKLHQMKSVGDVVEFYNTPVQNITSYAQLARDKSLPKNVAVREHAARFHPNDTHAPHGGITAYPGELGQVLGIRNKRLYRQYKPKKEWYDYEEQSFDYTPVDKDLPWDPEMVKKMDRYTDRKFNKGVFKKI
jgi:large subunit ribosomal protein L50